MTILRAILVGAGLFAAGFAWGRWHKPLNSSFTNYWDGTR